MITKNQHSNNVPRTSGFFRISFFFCVRRDSSRCTSALSCGFFPCKFNSRLVIILSKLLICQGENSGNNTKNETFRWGQRGIPLRRQIFFRIVAQTPSSFATWLMGRWKYLESSLKLIFFEGGIFEKECGSQILIVHRVRFSISKRTALCSFCNFERKGNPILQKHINQICSRKIFLLQVERRSLMKRLGGIRLSARIFRSPKSDLKPKEPT